MVVRSGWLNAGSAVSSRVRKPYLTRPGPACTLMVPAALDGLAPAELTKVKLPRPGHPRPRQPRPRARRRDSQSTFFSPLRVRQLGLSRQVGWPSALGDPPGSAGEHGPRIAGEPRVNERRRTNWAGNIAFGAPVLHCPSTVSECSPTGEPPALPSSGSSSAPTSRPRPSPRRRGSPPRPRPRLSTRSPACHRTRAPSSSACPADGTTGSRTSGPSCGPARATSCSRSTCSPWCTPSPLCMP
jgi:hypothetical protein